MQLSSQSVSWLPIIRYLVSFPCIYWRSLVLVHTQVLFLYTHKPCSCAHTSPVPVYTQVLFLCTHKSCCCIHTSPVPVHTQAHNTHHAFLHNAKFFFKPVHYNSGTLTVRRCRIFSQCNRVADRNLTEFRTFDKCTWKKAYWSHICDYTCHIMHCNTCTFWALTVNNATIKCEQQCKPKPVCYKNLAKLI